MNKLIDHGDPAFPTPSDAEYFGMSMRDWFAGQALAGLVSKPDDRFFGGASSDLKELEIWRCQIALDDAQYCYRMADAMMAARKEGK